MKRCHYQGSYANVSGTSFFSPRLIRVQLHFAGNSMKNLYVKCVLLGLWLLCYIPFKKALVLSSQSTAVAVDSRSQEATVLRPTSDAFLFKFHSAIPYSRWLPAQVTSGGVFRQSDDLSWQLESSNLGSPRQFILLGAQMLSKCHLFTAAIRSQKPAVWPSGFLTLLRSQGAHPLLHRPGTTQCTM